MARRQKRGLGQYHNRKAIPGAELAGPTSTTFASTPIPYAQQSRKRTRNNKVQPLTPESVKPSHGFKAPSNRGLSSPSDSPKAGNRHESPTPSKKPWELDLGYPAPNRVDNRVSFDWPSVWLSFPGLDLNLELQKELQAYLRFTLPLPLPSTNVAPEKLLDVDNENERIRSSYSKLGQAALFDLRMKNRNVQYDAALIFSSRLPTLNGLDSSNTLSTANAAANLDVSRPNFFNILNLPEVWARVLGHLKPNVRDLSGVAMTSKSAAVSMRGYFEVWDFHSGEFDVDKFVTKKDPTVQGLARGKYLQRRGVRSETLLITGGRQQTTDTPYSDSFESMLKLFKAVRLAPFCFRDVSLHRIPFLDTRVLEILIQGMPNLETLSISSCLLLDFTKLPRILNVILKNPRSQEDGAPTRKSYIKVDFSPYRFFGPLTSDKHGSFLITYHKPNFDIPKAATALLYRCLPDAKKAGMDLLGDSSSFWHFFRQLPGPCPLWAVKVRETILTQEKLGKGRNGYIKTLDNLCAAVSGDGNAPELLPARRNDRSYGEYKNMRLPYGYWQEERACPLCKTTLSRCLFVNCAPDNGYQRCWGCHFMQFVIEFDHSHFRYRKKLVLDHLFQKLPVTRAPEEAKNTKGAADGTITTTGAGPNASAVVSLNVTAVSNHNENTETGGTPKVAVKDTVKSKVDDGGIFDNSVFSVMTFSDPLGDEIKGSGRRNDGRSGPVRRKFSYKILNFMAQNIGAARRLAFKSDEAWNYYKGLKHLSEPLPDSKKHPPYPELDRGEYMTEAGTVYRWTRHRNRPVGPSDHLQGGPQYMYPFHESARPYGVTKSEPKISNFDEFLAFWNARYGDLGAMREAHLRKLEAGQIQETDFLEWANNTPFVQERREFAANSEWMKQHKRDWDSHFYGHAWHDDAIWSLCAPGRAVYSLDTARMEHERETAMWNASRYAGGHRF